MNEPAIRIVAPNEDTGSMFLHLAATILLVPLYMIYEPDPQPNKKYRVCQ